MSVIPEDVHDECRAKLQAAEARSEAAEREKYAVLWRALRDAGITRADGCPDAILAEEIERLRDQVESLLHRMTSEEAAQEIERLRAKVGRLERALESYDQLSLVIESAMREAYQRDPREHANYAKVCDAITQARAALAQEEGSRG